MKINNHKIIAGLLLLILIVAACEKDFDEVNTNTNSPETVPAYLLLPTIIKKPINEWVDEGWSTGNVVMQYSAKIQFTETSRYDWSASDDPYSTFYDAMRDVENIIDLSTESGEDNYVGIAMVMKCWMYSVLTDAYGEIPYSEAMQAKEGVNLPAFDEQETIYNGIISDLATANSLLDEDGVAVEGDILFDGDISQWKKFANSLLLRIHMRLSDRTDPSTALQTIVNDPTTYPIMESNDDNAALQYEEDSPNQQRLYTTRSGSFDEYRLCEYMEDILKGMEDTRLFAYAQPTTNSGAGLVGDWDDYDGVVTGLADEAALEYHGGSNYLSRIGLMFACSACDDNASPTAAQGLVMTYSEVQFILAEARQRGYIATSTAEDYYLNGIKASFDYYVSRLEEGGYDEIADAVVDDDAYYNQSAVAYTGTDEALLDKIALQKWLALFYTGLEGWYDWRRTDAPTITPGDDAVISTVPVRYMYPTDVQAYNADNYAEAIARQGEDKITTHVWWDVE